MKIFFDTMIFLHYKSPDQLSLVDLLGPPPHTILVPRITLRELDKHKNTHSSNRIRERARKVLKKIERWATGEEVSPKISLEFMLGSAPVDYEKLGLDPNWSDDVLIASIFKYIADHPDDTSVALITQDSGPRIMASHLGIRVLELPESYKLPTDPDPLEIENRELRRTISELQNAQPKLAIAFADSKDMKRYKSFALKPPPDSMKHEIAGKIKRLRAKLTKHSRSQTALSDPERLHILVEPIPEEEYERYNQDVNEYLKLYEAYLRETWENYSALKRSIQFKLEIWNTGTLPAEDVDVLLRFPNGFRLSLEKDLPGIPQAPSPPLKPRTRMQMMSDNIRIPQINFPHISVPDLSRPSSFSIRRTDSYEVRDYFQRIKHGDKVALPEIFLTFDSYESAASFSCEYMIRPANLPTPTAGDLHFVVDKENAA